jgi:transcriptional regulator with XRE-family HTH domain
MRTELVEPVLVEIRVWMARRHMNQSELAVRVGEAQPWVSKRLSGTVGLGVDDLVRIAKALEVPASEFLRPMPQPTDSRRLTELMQYRYNGRSSGKQAARSARTAQAAA